jgi:hypothetical protein
MIPFYRPSGRFGLLTFPLILVGLVAAVALAFVYQLALSRIPFIYLSFLATLAVGWLWGKIGSWIVKRGKVRSVTLAFLVGVLLAAAGLSAKFLFQYRTLLEEITSAAMEAKQIPEALRPDVRRELAKAEFTFAKHLKFRVERGWQLGRRRNARGRVGGFVVYLVWLIEAGIVFYASVKTPLKMAREPFSEPLNSWASETETVMNLPITSPEMVERIRVANRVESLLEIPIPKTDESNQFAVYRVHSIPGQDFEDAYLSVALMTIGVDKDGDPTKSESPLVSYAVLTAVQRHQLKDNANLLAEAMAEYRKSLEAEAAATPPEAESPTGGVPPGTDS